MAEAESHAARATPALSAVSILGEDGPAPPKAQLLPFGLVDRAPALVSVPAYELQAFREAFARPGPQFHWFTCKVPASLNMTSNLI